MPRFWVNPVHLHFQVLPTWREVLPVFVWPPLIHQPLASMDGCDARRWDRVCLWNASECNSGIHEEWSEHDQEIYEALGQLCQDRVWIHYLNDTLLKFRVDIDFLHFCFGVFCVRNPRLEGDDWPTFTPQNQEYVTLNYYHPVQKKMLRANECHLWKKLLPKIQEVSGLYSLTHTHMYTFIHFVATWICAKKRHEILWQKYSLNTTQRPWYPVFQP